MKLTVVHDGFEAGSAVASMVSHGWPRVLSDLKTLVETGETLPRQPGADHPGRPRTVDVRGTAGGERMTVAGNLNAALDTDALDRDSSRAVGNARARRRSLGRRGAADARNGHGRRDRARLVRVLRRPVGVDDGRDDAAGRGSGGRATRHASGRVRAVPSFVGSYLAVWTLVGSRCTRCTGRTGPLAAGAVVIAAGVYELTPLKQHFRRRCREGARSGLGFGLCCVGSSIGLMLMLLALGVMSVTWMSVIAVVVLAQKLLPRERSHRCAAGAGDRRTRHPGSSSRPRPFPDSCQPM